MNSNSENNLYSFLLNDDFINYVVNPSLVLDEMWDEYFQEHSDMIATADNAKDILLGSTITHQINVEDADLLLGNVFAAVNA